MPPLVQLHHQKLYRAVKGKASAIKNGDERSGFHATVLGDRFQAPCRPHRPCQRVPSNIGIGETEAHDLADDPYPLTEMSRVDTKEGP
jgi:hypothetical protein